MTTSKLRSTLFALKTQEERVDREFNRLGRRSCELSQEKQKLIPQIIREEKLLAGEWTVLENGALGSNWRNKQLEPLVDLVCPDYHCSQLVAEGVSLQFNDGDMFLVFEGHIDIIQFTKDNGIICKVDTRLKTKIKELEDKKKQLDSLLEKFGNGTNEERPTEED